MSLLVSYGIYVCVFVLVAVALGRRSGRSSFGSVLIDARGRYSLSRFQLVLWTALILPTFGAIVGAEVFVMAGGDSDGAVESAIAGLSNPLLGLMGISVGSASFSAAVKHNKNVNRARYILGSEEFAVKAKTRSSLASLPKHEEAHLLQMFLEEEGEGAGKTVDLGKLQHFFFTLTLAAIFIGQLVQAPGCYPEFGDQALWLIGLSHAGYIGNKIPNRS